MAPVAHRVPGIYPYKTFSRSREGIAVHAGMVPGGQFRRHALLRENDFVVARRGLFVLVRKRQSPHTVDARRYQEISEIRAAGARKVGMAEAQNLRVGVAIAGGAFPFRIGA